MSRRCEHKRITALLCILAFFFIVLPATLYVRAKLYPPLSASDQAFMSLADDYFDQFYFPTYPTVATQNGIHLYDDQLEDYSKAGIDININALKQFEKRILAVDPKSLSVQIQGDRLLILSNIRSQLLTLEVIKPWQKNPDYYSSGITNSAFVIMSRRFASTNQRLRSLIEREKRMPDVLRDAQQNITNPPKIYTQIALEQLPGIISFFRVDLANAFKDASDKNLLQEFKETNDAVIAALEQYQTWLKTTVLPRSNGDFKLGADTYRKKLSYDEMVDTPLDQLLVLGTKNMRQNQQAYARIAQELYPNKTLKQAVAELGKQHPAPNQLLNSFRATFDDLISFIHAKQIVTIPSTVKPILEESPPFLRAITFASMDTPGPFESHAQEAYFNVTLPESNWSKQRTDEFMSTFNYPNINDISIHETYPGHYVQFLWMHHIDDRVRKILGASSNAEGWAHYAEQMMLDEGFGVDKLSDRELKLLRLGQLENALLRNARFIVGIKLHTGQMSFNQAVDFFIKEGYLSPTAALVETKRGTMDPIYLYYTLGKLQILKLRHDLEQKQGAEFSLLDFHNDFMKQGFPPIKIVRKALLQDDSDTL